MPVHIYAAPVSAHIQASICDSRCPTARALQLMYYSSCPTAHALQLMHNYAVSIDRLPELVPPWGNIKRAMTMQRSLELAK